MCFRRHDWFVSAPDTQGLIARLQFTKLENDCDSFCMPKISFVYSSSNGQLIPLVLSQTKFIEWLRRGKIDLIAVPAVPAVIAVPADIAVPAVIAVPAAPVYPTPYSA